MMYRKVVLFSVCLLTLSLAGVAAWGQLAVTSFTLINADTDSPVAAHDPLVDGATVNLLEVGTSLNVRANVSGSPGSVRFAYDGNPNYQTENVAPYALAGDAPTGDYNSWTPTLGAHTLTATPYTGGSAGGTAGTPLTIDFTVVSQAGNQPPDVDAGPDHVLLWPSNNTVLVGSASDPDGSVTNVTWTQESGPGSATLGGENTTTLTANDLVLGAYVFRLTATDDEGDSAFDEASVYVTTGGTVTVTGELKKWHKVTVTFEGPPMSETGSPNPFMDRRLNVTFSHAGSGKSYVVPGYFAADGNAADTGAESGDTWRAHFAPDETGEWTWVASFRQGTDVAVDTNLMAGTSAGFMDGTGGSFSIAPTDKTGRDNRGKGRLQVVGLHHLRYAETGRHFLKCGADAPENLFAYDDFDGTPDVGGRRKSWQPHQQDYDAGDASVYTWDSGKGTELLGAIRYLADKGMNAFSHLTFNVDGDDNNAFAHRLSVTAAAYQALGNNTRWNNGVYKDRMDVSKLAQWERVYEYGDKLGMYIHFKTMETENELKMDGGNLGRERKVYYRELIARFSHHLALNWNLGEEINNASTAQKQAWAEYFWAVDPYRHNIVIHNGANHYDLLGSASRLTGFSLQTNNRQFVNVHGQTLNYIDRSNDAGKPWVVACDEPGDAQYALVPDANTPAEDPDRIYSRRNALWGHLMAGGAGLEFYFGYSLPNDDLDCEDWRSRDLFWPLGEIALDFFNKYTPFWLMSNRNDLIGNAANDIAQGYCLAKAGEVYVVFLPTGGTKNLNLAGAPGTYRVRWYNPRTGGALQNGTVTSVSGGGSVSIGMPPSDTGNDWTALILRDDADGDEDGLEDAWELTYFGGIDVSAGGSDDQDGDLFIDSDEQGAGTNPTDSNSLLRVSSFLPGGAGAIIQWPTVAGKTYDVSGTTDPSTNWTPVVTGLPAAANTYTVDTSATWTDYRIEVY